MKVDEAYKTLSIESFKSMVGKSWSMFKNTKFTFPELFPAFINIQISDGRIYAVTYKLQGDDHEVIILDLKGTILKRIFLPLSSMRWPSKNALNTELYTISDNHVYELLKNTDSGKWELQITEIK